VRTGNRCRSERLNKHCHPALKGEASFLFVIERFETKSIYCPKCMKEIGMLSPDEAAKKLGKFVKTRPRAKKERKFLKLLVEAKLVKESEVLASLI